MSYDITVIGGEIIRVTDEQGEKLKYLKLNGKPSDNIELGDDLIELGRIKQIKKVADPQPIKMVLPSPQDSTRCRGKRSIQFEIMKLIKKKYPTEWPKYFRDKAYKEKLRLWLREKSEGEWCDAKAGTCVCTSDYTPDPRRLRTVLEMFPGAEILDSMPQSPRKDLS